MSGETCFGDLGRKQAESIALESYLSNENRSELSEHAFKAARGLVVSKRHSEVYCGSLEAGGRRSEKKLPDEGRTTGR